jgi:hypothetical protein
VAGQISFDQRLGHGQRYIGRRPNRYGHFLANSAQTLVCHDRHMSLQSSPGIRSGLHELRGRVSDVIIAFGRAVLFLLFVLRFSRSASAKNEEQNG